MNFKKLFSSWKGALLILVILFVIGIILYVLYNFLKDDTKSDDGIMQKLDKILNAVNKNKTGASRSQSTPSTVNVGFNEV